jgi:hypothetical protein
VLTAVLLPRLMQAMFNVSVSFEQMVRALGLASIWGSVSVLGMLAGLMPLLACVIAPVRLVAAGAVAITYLIAIQEVSEMNWARTVSVAVFALFIQVLASQIAAVLLASLV